jgi:hypothetical protein
MPDLIKILWSRSGTLESDGDGGYTATFVMPPGASRVKIVNLDSQPGIYFVWWATHAGCSPFGDDCIPACLESNWMEVSPGEIVYLYSTAGLQYSVLVDRGRSVGPSAPIGYDSAPPVSVSLGGSGSTSDAGVRGRHGASTPAGSGSTSDAGVRGRHGASTSAGTGAGEGGPVADHAAGADAEGEGFGAASGEVTPGE